MRIRKEHGKKPLKDKDDNDKTPPSFGDNSQDFDENEIPEAAKTQKCSTTDPESGWFHKGEHKHGFAYGVQTGCDKNSWILSYTINPGNEHDSRIFKALYDKLLLYEPEILVMDAGYKTPAIARQLNVQKIKFCYIPLQTVMVIENIKVTAMIVRTVHLLNDVLKVRNM